MPLRAELGRKTQNEKRRPRPKQQGSLEISDAHTPHVYWRKALPYTTPDRIPIGAYKLDKPAITLQDLLKVRNDIPTRREAAEAYRVTDSTPITHTIEGEEYPALQCVTVDSGLWIVIFPDEEYRLDLEPEALPLNGAKQALKRRQERLRPPIEPTGMYRNDLQSAVDHEAVILLTLANWGRWAGKFYKGNAIPGRHLERWHEVDANHYGIIYQSRTGRIRESIDTCGRADFVGEGIDWRPIVIEAGAPIPRKVNQIDRQVIGIQAIAEEANHGQPTLSPVGFLATFWKEDGAHIVHYRSPLEIKNAA